MQRTTRKILVGGLTVVAAVGLALSVGVGSASAGGWALTSLDSVPVPVAGRSLDVGFTIRQHGVTRVNPTGDVGVSVESAGGRVQEFPAQAEGPPGHYVARVLIDEPGASTWQIRQGWVPPQDLGVVEVRDSPAPASTTGAPDAAGPGSVYRWPAAVRLLLPAIGLGLGVFAIADVMANRRRRSRELAAT
jgi:hypothetical protein